LGFLSEKQIFKKTFWDSFQKSRFDKKPFEVAFRKADWRKNHLGAPSENRIGKKTI
jgi:hypothetical protein